MSILICWIRIPMIAGEWTKQTIYLYLINCFHQQSKDATSSILLIDDDSGKGIYQIKNLCEQLGIKASFAIIPSMVDSQDIDSLIYWQKNGYGISLHGYNHKDWRELKYEEIANDIKLCEMWLKSKGFISKDVRIIVTPHGSNNAAVRKAIKDKGYQMVAGANILNPDTKVFQLGRIMITKYTDLNEIYSLMKKAKEKNLFMILGTHSSMPEEFSLEKTKAVLQMAIDMKFEFLNK